MSGYVDHSVYSVPESTVGQSSKKSTLQNADQKSSLRKQIECSQDGYLDGTEEAEDNDVEQLRMKFYDYLTPYLDNYTNVQTPKRKPSPQKFATTERPSPVSSSP